MASGGTDHFDPDQTSRQITDLVLDGARVR